MPSRLPLPLTPPRPSPSMELPQEPWHSRADMLQLLAGGRLKGAAPPASSPSSPLASSTSPSSAAAVVAISAVSSAAAACATAKAELGPERLRTLQEALDAARQLGVEVPGELLRRIHALQQRSTVLRQHQGPDIGDAAAVLRPWAASAGLGASPRTLAPSTVDFVPQSQAYLAGLSPSAASLRGCVESYDMTRRFAASGGCSGAHGGCGGGFGCSPASTDRAVGGGRSDAGRASAGGLGRFAGFGDGGDDGNRTGAGPLPSDALPLAERLRLKREAVGSATTSAASHERPSSRPPLSERLRHFHDLLGAASLPRSASLGGDACSGTPRGLSSVLATTAAGGAAAVERADSDGGSVARADAAAIAEERWLQAEQRRFEQESMRYRHRHAEQAVQVEEALLAQSLRREEELVRELADLERECSDFEATDLHVKGQVRLLQEEEAVAARKQHLGRRLREHPRQGGEHGVAGRRCLASADDLPEVYQAAVALILEHGWDALHGGENAGPSWTALHWAAVEGRADVCRLLLDAAADPLHEDEAGCSPLDYAVSERHQAIADMLSMAERQATSHGAALSSAFSAAATVRPPPPLSRRGAGGGCGGHAAWASDEQRV